MERKTCNKSAVKSGSMPFNKPMVLTCLNDMSRLTSASNDRERDQEQLLNTVLWRRRGE
jgi:hypothetical protein